LLGLYLSDEPANRSKWAFPANVSIPAQGYLIVWLDNDDLQGPFHANFKLAAGGESLILSDGASIVIDEVSFGQQLPDITFGRYPNGTGSFTFLPPTFNAQNSQTIGVSNPENQVNLRIYPNPNTGHFRLESNQDLGLIKVFNTTGQQVYQQATELTNHAELHLTALPEGVYLVQAGNTWMKWIKS
jgi:hypothetical protein